MEGKNPSESYTEQVHLVRNADLNGYKRLFGGVLMQWIDTVAAIVAMRHSNRNITTASVDQLNFFAKARANDLVVSSGKITYAGKTSMEVRVRSYVEHLDGTRVLINEAYLVMVALDENEKPTSVPPLIPETEEEKMDMEAGAQRRQLREYRKDHKI